MTQKRSSVQGGVHGMGRGSWQLQDAKARFSELFRLVGSQGPQRVTRQGKESVVVLRAEQYDELINRKKGPKSIVDFFAQSPLVNAGLTLRRSFDGGRNIRL